MTSPTTTTREELERIVRDLHHAHYTAENPNGLWKPDESPNANTIYKLWSDGEITYEKGGHAFGDRSLKQLRGPIVHISKSLLPKFPVCFENGNSYAILTVDECYEVCRMLKEYFDPYIQKRVEVRTVDVSSEVLRRLIGEMIMSDLRVVYRSPKNDMFVVQSLMGTAEDVRVKMDTHLSSALPEGSYSYTFVD